MVFIAIGALKAAKVAKKEYEKDKKRSQIIAPLDNSRRTAFDNAPASASPEWWGSEETTETEARPVEHPSQASFGAWSRDTLMQQIAKQEARQEDYDARFREQLSNSSASLPSTAVPSASHSPALALRHAVPVPTEQTHSSSGSLKQLLPPAVSEPIAHQEQAPTSPASQVLDAAQTIPSQRAPKPPRPVSLPSAIDGSYEAALHSSSTRSKHAEDALAEGAGLRTVSSMHEAPALLHKPSEAPLATHPMKREKVTSAVQGSFEEALKDGTAHMRRFKSAISTSDGVSATTVAPVSAFSNTPAARRRGKLHSDVTPLHDVANATSEERHTGMPQQSAFATTQGTKGFVRRVSGIKSNSDNVESALARTGSMRKRQGVGNAVPESVIKPHASTRQKTLEAHPNSTGDQIGQTFEERLGTTASPSSVQNATNPSSTIPPSSASCMSAVGSMKKRRSRRPSP